MPKTKNSIVQNTVKTYCDMHSQSKHPSPPVIEQDLLDALRLDFALENSVRKVNHEPTLKAPEELEPAMIAPVIATLYPVARISLGGPESAPDLDVLGLYQTDGDRKGIYAVEREAFSKLIHEFNPNLTTHSVEETMVMIKELVPREVRCTQRNLVPVNNGVFDFDTKQLLPFDPSMVFLSKSRVNYNPLAANPMIQAPDGTWWDVDSWMNALSDDPEIVTLLWQIMGAVIRPLVPWHKSVWFYSNTGNNGKGTLCELMRQLCGPGTYVSLPLSEMGKDFMLEPLIRASAIIVDENDVGIYIDKAANLKAIITNDVIMINRKFKMPIAYQFHGLMVQCLNELPRIKDKSDSFFRRQIFVPFTKCFTGRERKYIKDAYLKRTDVLEYVLFKVLNMDYYELSEPAACKIALAEYKEYNDPIRQFASDILSAASWDLLPSTLLYDLYKAWMRMNNPGGSVLGRNNFIKEIADVIQKKPGWEWHGEKQKVKGATRMAVYEPLLATYGLKNWMNPDTDEYRDSMVARCTPKKGQFSGYSYCGALRV